MSFNQKSGKYQERKSSVKWNRAELYRKPVVVVGKKINLKSQRETNIQTCTFEDSSLKQDSSYILPSIIRQKNFNDSKISPNKSYFSSRFFSEENTKVPDQEQNLFIVKQNQKSISINKSNLINPWYKKLRKKQQNIILNYINIKVETQRVKKKKRKIKRSISNERIIENNQFLSNPAQSIKKHRRNLTQFKALKLDKIKLNETLINRRQSLPIYKPEQPLTPVHFFSKTQNQSQTIDNIQQRIHKMKKDSLQANEYRPMGNKEKQIIYSIQGKYFSKQQLQRKKLFAVKYDEKISRYINQKLKRNKKNQQDTKITTHVKLEDSIINEKSKNIKIKNKQKSLYSQSKHSFIYLKQQSGIIQLTDQHQNQLEIYPPQNSKINKKQKIDTITLEQQTQTLNMNLNEKIINPQQTQKESKFQLQENNQFQHHFMSLRIPDKSFLRIKTYYFQVRKKIKNQIKLNIPEDFNKELFLKKLPHSNQIVSFVQKYTLQSHQMKVSQLIKHQNFRILLEQNKQFYFGLIKNKMKQGFGVTIKQGYLFQGFYKQGKKVKGIQINSVGKYIGEFRNNKREGKGDFYWNNGQNYIGEWTNGKKHGKGVWQSPNGDLYDGDWVRGKVQGYGMHKSSNGQKYKGFFHQFLKSGRGTQILPNRDQYQGQFSKGKPHGKGKYLWNSGQIYEGQFSHGFRNGFGKLQDTKGNIYKGFFINQQASGKCEIDFDSQDFYKGSVCKGFFNGQGTLKLHDSITEQRGFWVFDKLIKSSDFQIS